MGIDLGITGTFKPKDRSPQALLERIAAWIESQETENVPITSRLIEADGDEPDALFVNLHPAADEVQIGLAAKNKVLVTARTNTAGPGYHEFVCAMIDRLGAEFSITWQREPGADETDYFLTRDRAALEQSMLEWLRAMLQGVRQHIADFEPGGSPMMLCMSLNTPHPVGASTPVMTPMGSRSRAWVDRGAADPTTAHDFWVWWDSGPSATMLRNTAIHLMWCACHWSPPVTQDDADMLVRIHRLLAEAHELDPALSLPWHDWLEVIEMVREVESRPAEEDDEEEEEEIGESPVTIEEEMLVRHHADEESRGTPIGYFRGDVLYHFPTGWMATLPGSMSPADTQDSSLVLVDEDRHFELSLLQLADDYVNEDPRNALQQMLEIEPRQIRAVHGDGWEGFGAERTSTDEEARHEVHAAANVNGVMMVASITVRDESLIPWARQTIAGMKCPGDESDDDEAGEAVQPH